MVNFTSWLYQLSHCSESQRSFSIIIILVFGTRNDSKTQISWDLPKIKSNLCHSISQRTMQENSIQMTYNDIKQFRILLDLCRIWTSNTCFLEEQRATKIIIDAYHYLAENMNKWIYKSWSPWRKFTVFGCSSLAHLSFLITVVSVNKLRLIWLPSLSLTPSAFVWEARSLPARSTKFCKVTALQSTRWTAIYDWDSFFFFFFWLWISTRQENLNRGKITYQTR